MLANFYWTVVNSIIETIHFRQKANSSMPVWGLIIDTVVYEF